MHLRFATEDTHFLSFLERWRLNSIQAVKKRIQSKVIDLYLTRLLTTPLNGSTFGLLTEGLRVIERFFRVPLDYSDPSGEKITVFARQTIPTSKARTSEEQEELPISAYTFELLQVRD